MNRTVWNKVFPLLLLLGSTCLSAAALPATASAAASQPKHDTGPTVGPAAQGGLKPIGRLRLRLNTPARREGRTVFDNLQTGLLRVADPRSGRVAQSA